MKSFNTMKTLLGLTVVAILLVIGAVPAVATETDSRIESAAMESHTFKSYLADDAIKVHSVSGVVTLSGTVASDAHKALAEDTVANLPGVKGVENKLEVTGEKPAEKSDTWIAIKVKTALIYHKNVSGTKTSVDVKDGIVTLSGEAESRAQADLTTEYAKDVEGVKDVRNEMTIAGKAESNEPSKAAQIVSNVKDTARDIGDKIDDASVTAMVKMTLFSHRSTSAANTTVHTTDGVVTLSGMARSAAEKDLAAKYASDVHGVNNVINNMTIEKSPPTSNS